MNTYGKRAQDFSRRHRPAAYSEMADPTAYFTAVGETLAIAISDLAAEIIGRQRPDETIEAFRLRTYQARSTAEELILSDHHLFQPEDSPDDETNDPALDQRLRVLSQINEAINQRL